ncbi:MAG: M81 family metallopeptidase [Actinomycetota bacterium]
MTRVPRVGVIGYMHEVNALAESITLAHGLQTAETPGGLAQVWEVGGVIARLRELREVEIVELPVWEFGASGPLLDADFHTMLGSVVDALYMAGPLDAVAMMGHGAGRTTTDLDADATFLRAVRSVVGDVPLVAVFDFHANVSAAMCECCDVVVGYRTNPHIDVVECGREAAEHIHRLLDEPGSIVAHVKLPVVLPQLAQNTLPGEPLADVMALASAGTSPPVRTVSVFGGFSLGDTADGGVSVCVTADSGCGDEAAELAESLARAVWVRRGRFRMTATPLDEAVTIASRAARGERPPVLLADTADNPGGGAPGNSTFVLAALHAAHVSDVVMGLHCDRGVVEAAWEAGVGAEVEVEFNAASHSHLAAPFGARATVLSLVDDVLVPTRGVYRDSTRRPGPSCALDIAGIRVGVSSHKVQCADDDTLRHVGLDPSTAKVVVVKSRGHFRAGFDHLFADDQIIEVGTPGVAPADIDHVPTSHLRRPAWPFDDIADWQPHAELHERGVR